MAIRDELIRAVHNSKTRYFSSRHVKSPKDIWKLINKVTKPSKRCSNFSNAEIDNINQTFKNVFQPSTPINFSSDTASSTIYNLTEYDIFTIIMSLKSNCPGVDGVPGSIYKRYWAFLIPPLRIIINKSLSLGRFPASWKFSNIIPIKKPNGEYRPISLLPFSSKILEKAFLKFILLPDVLHKFNHKQFAFLPLNHTGTTMATAYLRLFILNCLTSHKGYVRCLSVDFLKAFDKAPHASIIHSCIHDFCLASHKVNWITSFLSNRHQRVITKTYASDWAVCTSGVPQGSILGPILFCMLVNNFNVTNANSTYVLYADDLIILHHVPPYHQDHMQSEVNHLLSWASSKDILINNNKTRITNFSFSPIIAPPVYFQNTVIAEVDTLKILGVIFRHDSSVVEHGNYTLRRAAAGMAAVRKLFRSGIQGKHLWSAYMAFVFCHMSYCWPTVCDMPKSITNKFAVLEKEVCRLSHHNPAVTLPKRLNKICVSTIKSISTNPLNPVRACFLERHHSNTYFRHRCRLIPHNNSTKLIRTFASFYKFS